MNYNVTVNGKVYSVSVEKTGAAAPVVAAPVAAPAPRVASSSPLSSALVALFRRASVLAS